MIIIKNKISKISKATLNTYSKYKRIFKFFYSIFLISLIFIIIISFISTIYFGIEIPRLNNLITLKQGELNEIKIYRDNIKDIDDKYTNLKSDIIEKDYEVYYSTDNLNMSEQEAIIILKSYAQLAYELFIDFIKAGVSKFFVYVDYDILTEFQNKFLQPWWSEQPISERTWNIINFEVLISENDNITEYLYKRTLWGEFDLNNFLEDESEFGTFDLINLINETKAMEVYWYSKTWDILYTYSSYGVINIDVDLQLYDRIVQKYYEKPILEIKNQRMEYEIYLALSSFSVIFLTFLLDILRRKSTSKKIKDKNQKIENE